MAILPVQDASLVAVVPTMQTLADGGDSFPNNGLVLLEVDNASAGTIVTTANDMGSPTPAGTLVGTFNPDVQCSVDAGQRKIWGPFPPWRFNDASGRVNLTYSVNPPTGQTIGLYRMRP